METAATIKLTEDQAGFFFNEGYLAMDAITTPEDVAYLREIYDRLFAQQAGRADGNQFDLAGTDEEGKEAVLPQIIKPSQYAPELKDSLYWRNALAIAQQLFGPEIKQTGEHMIYKPPRISPETPWHQDQAYHNADQIARSVTIWMPLQDVKVENGCMQFVPRSHKMDVLPHHSINNDPRIHGIETDDPGKWHKLAAICPVPAGGATLHHSYTLHYTGPNVSDIPRRAYILSFSMPSVKREKALDFYWMKEKQTAREERQKAKAGVK